uniref:BTB domain-containing protein n=1 Tax=Macrostomum lignano TaxID=282301 RepID=A0A1I8FJI9_9PLAT
AMLRLTADLTLSAGGASFPLHKNVVLVLAADYFRAAFSSGMRAKPGASCLELNRRHTPRGLQAVLEFVYTGSLALSVVDRAEDISIRTSHLFRNFEDLCRMRRALQRLTARLSYPTCWLGDIGLRVAGEYLVFFAVRLPLLSGEHLVEKVSCIGFMRDVPACSDRLTEAKTTTWWPVMQTPRTSRVRNHQRAVFLANFLYACGRPLRRQRGLRKWRPLAAFATIPDSTRWHELVPMNEARKDFAPGGTGNSCLMAIGGQDENMVMCTVERLCIATGEWRFLPSLQHRRLLPCCAVCDSRVFVSGGQRYDGYCDSLICYEPDSELWASRAAMLNKRAGNHIMECVGSHIYGFPVPVTPIESYNSIADQWTLLRCSITIREAGSCVLDSRIYIAGGLDGENYYSHSLQVYDTQKDEVQLVERFPTRIYGRVCCLMTLPQDQAHLSESKQRPGVEYERQVQQQFLQRGGLGQFLLRQRRAAGRVEAGPPERSMKAQRGGAEQVAKEQQAEEVRPGKTADDPIRRYRTTLETSHQRESLTQHPRQNIRSASPICLKRASCLPASSRNLSQDELGLSQVHHYCTAV